MQIKTQKRKAISTVGIAGLVAIFAVSMIAYNFTAQQVIAEPANKVAFDNSVDGLIVGWDAENGCRELGQPDGDMCTNKVPLKQFEITTSDKGDWLVDFSAQCSTGTLVSAKGKQADLSGAISGAKVTLEYTNSLGTFTHPTDWILCQQDFQVQANLNDIIFENDEGNLEFICNEDGTLKDPSLADETLEESCQQFVNMYLKSTGSYNTKWILSDLEHGTHQITIYGELQAGPSGEFATVEETGGIPGGIDAFVDIGTKVVVAEPIHVVG